MTGAREMAAPGLAGPGWAAWDGDRQSSSAERAIALAAESVMTGEDSEPTRSKNPSRESINSKIYIKKCVKAAAPHAGWTRGSAGLRPRCRPLPPVAARCAQAPRPSQCPADGPSRRRAGGAGGAASALESGLAAVVAPGREIIKRDRAVGGAMGRGEAPDPR